MEHWPAAVRRGGDGILPVVRAVGSLGRWPGGLTPRKGDTKYCDYFQCPRLCGSWAGSCGRVHKPGNRVYTRPERPQPHIRRWPGHGRTFRAAIARPVCAAGSWAGFGFAGHKHHPPPPQMRPLNRRTRFHQPAWPANQGPHSPRCMPQTARRCVYPGRGVPTGMKD